MWIAPFRAAQYGVTVVSDNKETFSRNIRLRLYEETKHLTIEERIKRTNDKARKLAEQYGFTIGTPKSVIEPMIFENPAV